MSESLPTLEIAHASSHTPTSLHGANLTARLYSTESRDVHLSVHLPKVEPKARGSKVKVLVKARKGKSKAKESKAKDVQEISDEQTDGQDDNVSLSSSDSEGSYSSFSSSGSDDSCRRRNSEKTETDFKCSPPFRRNTGNSVLKSASLDTASLSPALSISVSLPSVLPAAEVSPTVENMRHHLASNLSRHNHHILLHNGQCALNSHIRITVNSKAAHEIAAHAVVTEVPALLPLHRQRAAHQAALAHAAHAGHSPLSSPHNAQHSNMPAIAPARGLSLALPLHADSAPRRHSTGRSGEPPVAGLKSPLLSPRGTALLSPLYGRTPSAATPHSAHLPAKESPKDHHKDHVPHIHHPPSPLLHHTHASP